MRTLVESPSWNRNNLSLVLLLLSLVQLCACAEKKEPIGVVTTTNYCKGIITASNIKVKPGYIALSRDLEKKHKLKFGDLIYLDNESEPYVFMDRMPLQWKRHADVYSRKCKDAKEYGVQKRMLWFVRK